MGHRGPHHRRFVHVAQLLDELVHQGRDLVGRRSRVDDVAGPPTPRGFVGNFGPIDRFDHGSVDWRVAEVRLLRERATVGKVGPDEERADDNLVIQGDALAALKSLTDLPEFADSHAGKVRLAYIDPPLGGGCRWSGRSLMVDGW